jgi:octaprenyl-diphosphate synthase
MPALEHIKKPVEKEIRVFEKYFKASMKSKVPLLDIVTNYLYRRKGKQLRPVLVFLSARLNGEPNESTNIAAAMIELLHTATLIHDDVVDDSYERRGFFSVYALWKSKISVLVGDFLLSKGLLLAINNKEFELLHIISEAVREMSEGELLQLQKSRKLDITEEEYLEIIRKKTATLISACVSCGASSVGTTPENLAKLKLMGEYAGLAFQIKDDLFDYEKDCLTGKPRGNDIKEKKLTLPLIHALGQSSDSERRRIKKLIRNNNNKSKTIGEIIDYVIDKGSVVYAVEKMEDYRLNAVKILKEFPDNEAKTALIELLSYITTRKK